MELKNSTKINFFSKTEMIDFSVLYICAVICVMFYTIGMCFYWILLRHSQLKKAPPGPLDFPFLGSIFFTKSTKKSLRRKLSSLKTKYGSVHRLYIGSQFAVIINDFASMVSAFRDHERNLLQRVDHPTMKIIHQEGIFNSSNKDIRWKGLLFASGTHWEIVSLFTRTALYHCQREPAFVATIAFGAGQLSDGIMSRLTQQLPSFRSILHKNISETIASLLIGAEFSSDTAKMSRLSEFLTDISTSVSTGSFSGHCPFRNNFSQKRSFFEKKLHTVNQDLFDEIRKKFTNKKPFEENFTGFYLNHLAAVRGFKGETVEKLIFSENELVALLLDLMIGGSVPLVEILYEGLVLLAQHKHVQGKVQAELDEFALGKKSPFATHPYDYDKLPYLTGTCCEILRLVTVTKFGACRKTTASFELGTYRIASQALLIANLHSIHRDPKHWRLPEVFLPDRYFAADGSFNVPPSLVPYSIGERACPGGYMATHMLIAYVSALMRRYTVVLGPYSNFEHSQPYYDLRFEARSEANLNLETDDRSATSASL